MALTKAELNQWCDFLEQNPDKKTTGCLMSGDGNMCCLGALAVLQGVPHAHAWDDEDYGFTFPGSEGGAVDAYLAGDLKAKLGSSQGHFGDLGMPDLEYDGEVFCCAALANDSNNFTWPEIAAHFRKHYKTQD